MNILRILFWGWIAIENSSVFVEDDIAKAPIVDSWIHIDFPGLVPMFRFQPLRFDFQGDEGKYSGKVTQWVVYKGALGMDSIHLLSFFGLGMWCMAICTVLLLMDKILHHQGWWLSHYL